MGNVDNVRVDGEPDYLEEVMDLQPGAMIAYSPQFDVSWRNRTAEHYAPGAAPGKNLYDALVPFANEEKIDRLLLKSEKVMFSAGSAASDPRVGGP